MKDGFVLWRRMRLFLVFIVVMAAVPSSFYCTFVVAWASMLPFTTVGYDEQCKWNKLAAMMPYSKLELVLSKYLLGWLCILSAAALALTLPILTYPLFQRFGGWSAARPAPLTVFLSLCAAACVLAVTLPPLLYFGVEKGRMVTLLMIALVCGASGAVSTLLDGGGTLPISAAALLPVLAAALTAVSVPLSIRLYARRQGGSA